MNLIVLLSIATIWLKKIYSLPKLTYRWRILLIHMQQKPHCFISKHTLDTRWSARADAT